MALVRLRHTWYIVDTLCYKTDVMHTDSDQNGNSHKNTNM